MMVLLMLAGVWFWWRWPISGVLVWRLLWLVVGVALLAVLVLGMLWLCLVDYALKPLADWAADQAEVLE